MKSTVVAPGINTVEGLLSEAECEALVERAEHLGFEPAPIVTARGPRVASDTRNNDRCVFGDVHLAAKLWSRTHSFVPQVLNDRHAIGLNERFRLYRYTPGQRFYWHSDVPYRRNNGDMSLLTFIVYLNDGYSGGETRFEVCKVFASQGTALIFHHGMVHEGAEVTRGTKYALRSDVMFSARAQRGLTLRSRRPSTAWHLGREP
ncbi:prolyl hydroxylase family protein, partial [Piscinibacter defluvii]|uniref:prolyl hydroxylase family protein n=1 Tax=Piscinibacter defluvii TaxID=1796922 RepID=UPI0013E3D3E7